MDKYSRFGLAFKKNFLTLKGANPVFYVAQATTLPEYDGDRRGELFCSVFTGVDLSDDVAIKAAAEEVLGKRTQRYVLFDELGSWIHLKWMDCIDRLIPHPDPVTGTTPDIPVERVQEIEDELLRIGLLEGYVFGFLKFFDHTRSDDDLDNFYMEREWRIFGNLKFDLSDVERVILPRSYSEKLRVELPGYFGQVTFSD
jgi:hypothetical protein